MIALAALAAGLACLLLLGPPPVARLRDREMHEPAGRPWGPRQIAPLAIVVGTAVVGWAIGAAAGVAVAVSAAFPVLTGVYVWRRHRRRAVAETRSEQVMSACQLLAGLLRVGHVPAAALQAAAADEPVLAEAAALLQIGSPVGATLRKQGGRPGCAGLTELGVAWEVAERTGASLTATLEALTERLAGRQAARDVVSAELSAPRATGRLLAVLPVVGMLLGYSFGGDPLAFLTGSIPGQISLVTGSVLGCAGVLWTERIAEAGSD